MILNHQKFNLGDVCLIEKISIQAPFRFAVNFHNEACFIYFSQGATKITAPDVQKKLEPEESVLLKCGSYFTDLLEYSPKEQYEILVIHLYPELLRKIYKHDIPSFVKRSNNKTFINKIVSNKIIQRFIDSLYFYFDNPALVNDEILELKVKELVLLLIQTRNATSIVDLFSNLFTPRTISIKEVVNKHMFSDLSISDLASLSNLSISTFNRTFQSLFNDTPANYIKVKRLERAKQLLKISASTVSEIAFQTCFNDVAHFSRSFKAVYHCTPSEFRSSL